jgi:hypothetical protein
MDEVRLYPGAERFRADSQMLSLPVGSLDKNPCHTSSRKAENVSLDGGNVELFVLIEEQDGRDVDPRWRWC